MSKKDKTKRPKKKSIALQRKWVSGPPEIEANLKVPGVAQAGHILVQARDALNALNQWQERSVVDPLIDVLHALAECVLAHGNTKALEAEGGPVRWARIYLQQAVDRAGAARTFVDLVQDCLNELPRRGGELEDQGFAHLFVWHMKDYLGTAGKRQGLLDDHPEPDPNAQEISIQEVQKAAARSPLKAYDFAIALLVGWGVDRDRAHTILRPSERAS